MQGRKDSVMLAGRSDGVDCSHWNKHRASIAMIRTYSCSASGNPSQVSHMFIAIYSNQMFTWCLAVPIGGLRGCTWAAAPDLADGPNNGFRRHGRWEYS